MNAKILPIGLLVLAVILSGCTQQSPPASQLSSSGANANMSCGSESLTKPLKEYALSLADLPADYTIDENSTGYNDVNSFQTYPFTKTPIPKEKLAIGGLQEVYSATFFVGEPNLNNRGLLSHELIKFTNAELSKQYFGDSRDEIKKEIEPRPDLSQYIAISDKGDECYAIKISWVYNSQFKIFLRTRNIVHIISLSTNDNISIQSFLPYVDKIIEKTCSK